MKNVLLILSIAAVLLLFSCKKEQPPASGSISGNLSSYDPATPLVKTPVAGIKLWLVNADFKFDTVTFAGNRAAIVDSTYSDANGNSRFSSIPLGNYYVSPLPDTAGYRFEPVPEGNTDPLAISETSPDQNLSFSSPFPGGVNDEFSMKITVIPSSSGDYSYFHWKRQYFIFFIPYFTSLKDLFGESRFFIIDTPHDYNNEYGFTIGLYTLTNNFLFDFYNSQNVLIESYWAVQDLGNTPAVSEWTINLNDNTITRTLP